MSILYERNKYDRNQEQKEVNFYLILNKINNNEIVDSFSVYSRKEININKILNKGNYNIWIYIPQEYNRNNFFKSSFKIVFNKKIIIDFNKFDEEFNYIHQISKNKILIKKEGNKYEQKKEIDTIRGFNIINGFYIITSINKVNSSFKLEYNINIKGDIGIISKGFEKIDNNKLFINDTLNPNETKVYIY